MAVRYNQITLTGTDDAGSSVFFIKNNSIFARELGGNSITSYTGRNNTVYGKHAAQLLKNANNNVIVGYGAGYNTNFPSAIYSSDNTFVGTNAGYDNTSGFKNTYIGANSSKSLKKKTTYFNVCVGVQRRLGGSVRRAEALYWLLYAETLYLLLLFFICRYIFNVLCIIPLST